VVPCLPSRGQDHIGAAPGTAPGTRVDPAELLPERQDGLERLAGEQPEHGIGALVGSIRALLRWQAAQPDQGQRRCQLSLRDVPQACGLPQAWGRPVGQSAKDEIQAHVHRGCRKTGTKKPRSLAA